MPRRAGSQRKFRPHSRSTPYSLIVRRAGKRLRSEFFADASSYRARLAKLHPSNACGVSIDDVLEWLDAHAEPGQPQDK